MKVYNAYVEDLSELGGPMHLQHTVQIPIVAEKSFTSFVGARNWLLREVRKRKYYADIEKKILKYSGKRSFYIDSNSAYGFGITIKIMGLM